MPDKDPTDAEAPEAGSLDGLVRRVDPDRWMSSRFIADPQRRADAIAIYAYDHELGRATRASNPILGEIRLAWWREALDEVYGRRPARQHPGVQALAAAIARHHLPRAPLDAMNEARYRDLDPKPLTEDEALDWSRDTAGAAARLVAVMLDPAADLAAAEAVGAAWALARRFPSDEVMAPAVRRQRDAARGRVRRLSVAAFPAVAHAALAGHPDASEFARRMRLTWAVARGRI